MTACCWASTPNMLVQIGWSCIRVAIRVANTCRPYLTRRVQKVDSYWEEEYWIDPYQNWPDLTRTKIDPLKINLFSSLTQLIWPTIFPHLHWYASLHYVLLTPASIFFFLEWSLFEKCDCKRNCKTRGAKLVLKGREMGVKSNTKVILIENFCTKNEDCENSGI